MRAGGGGDRPPQRWVGGSRARAGRPGGDQTRQVQGRPWDTRGSRDVQATPSCACTGPGPWVSAAGPQGGHFVPLDPGLLIGAHHEKYYLQNLRVADNGPPQTPSYCVLEPQTLGILSSSSERNCRQPEKTQVLPTLLPWEVAVPSRKWHLQPVRRFPDPARTDEQGWEGGGPGGHSRRNTAMSPALLLGTRCGGGGMWTQTHCAAAGGLRESPRGRAPIWARPVPSPFPTHLSFQALHCRLLMGFQAPCESPSPTRQVQGRPS